jgi:hypothetical protein
MDNLLVIGILIEIFSITCGLLSYYSYHWGSKLTSTALGTIIDIEFGILRGGKLFGYFPVVEFSDGIGRKYYFKSLLSVAWPKSISLYNKGDEIKVKYNPNKPSEAIIGSVWLEITRIFVPFILILTGILFFFIGIISIGIYILFINPAFMG